MDYFSIIYKDPLFSIIVIIAIITLVAIADYTKNRYKQKIKQQSLSDFAKNFENYGTDENIGSLANKLKSIDFGKETLEKQKLELETSRKEVENKKRA